MKTYFDCIPCFIRQALDSVRLITDDEAIQEQLLRRVLLMAGNMDMSQTPPAMAKKIHQIILTLLDMGNCSVYSYHCHGSWNHHN